MLIKLEAHYSALPIPNGLLSWQGSIIHAASELLLVLQSCSQNEPMDMKKLTAISPNV